MEEIRTVVYLVKSKGFSWKTYLEDKNQIFNTKKGERHVLLGSLDRVPVIDERARGILDLIRSKKPKSIKALAELLQMDYGNTNKLVHGLYAAGVLNLIFDESHPKAPRCPSVDYKHLVTTVITTDAFIARYRLQNRTA